MQTQIAAVLMITLLAGCAASPRQRVVSAGAVDTGANSLTAARQQLEGQWVLEGMTFNTEDGKSAAVDATGRLTMDGFGNLSIEFTMTEAGLKSLADMGIKYPNPRMSTSGAAAINTQSREITYVGNRFTSSGGMDPETAKRRQNPFALERIRYYTIDAQGILTLATRYNDGKDAVTSKWKKAS